MTEARLSSNWDLMASLQYQLGLFMSKDKAAMKALKLEHFHPLKQPKKKHIKEEAKETWAEFKSAFTKKGT